MIFILEYKNNAYTWNQKTKVNLPEPIAYCGCTSTLLGIAYAGGENMGGLSKKAWLLTWNEKKECVDIKSLPDLPVALNNISLSHIENMVYAAGGDEVTSSSKYFLNLDLENIKEGWRRLPDLPVALANTTLIAQKGKIGNSLFLVGGRSKTSSGISDLHSSVFKFNLENNEWKRCNDISTGQTKLNLSAASGLALEEDFILMIGGDNGETFHKIETYLKQIINSNIKEDKEEMIVQKNKLVIHHKGFDQSLLLFNIAENKWSKIGEYPFPAQVTTHAVKWGNKILVPNGEIRPGLRTPDIIMGFLP